MITALEAKPLGYLLLAKGLVRPEQLEQALAEQKRNGHQKLLGEVLVEMRLCTEDQITEALAQAYDAPYARLSPRLADPKVIPILPREFLEKHQVVPLFLVEAILTVAVPEPANLFLLEEIERLSGFHVQVVAAPARDIKSTLQAYLHKDGAFVVDDLIEDQDPDEFSLIEPPQTLGQDIAVSKLVNFIIHNAIKERASDIHIETGPDSIRVRYRIDGRLAEKLRPPFAMHTAIARRIKIIAGMDPEQERLPQTGVIRARVRQNSADFRVVSMPAQHGEVVVVRIGDQENATLNLEKLGFGYDTLKAWRKLINLPSGLILVTGPMGCGITTTMYASLLEINRNDLNVSTIEDPVECTLPGVNQFQIDEKSGFTFPQALQSLAQQRADIVMVGQIRDAETAKMALQAALSGQLVFGAMHTGDAPSVIARLYHMGIEPYLVGSTLAGVLAQRLVPRLCQHCRIPHEPTVNERRLLDRIGCTIDRLYEHKGCNICNNIGYTMRIAIHELLISDDALTETMSRGATLEDLRKQSRKSGMRTLREDGLEKVRAGITTLDQILRMTA